MGECCICLEPMVDDGPPVTTACNHGMHLKCMLELASHSMLAGHLIVRCPLCRSTIYSHYKASELDRDLLRAVTRADWAKMRELKEQGARFVATIEVGDYPDNINRGMMPLHFAVRDHAPLNVLREIYEAYPQALSVHERNGCTPRDLLARTTPNAPNWSDEDFAAAQAFLEQQAAEAG